MLVRAKRMGYYNHKRIREGEEFVLKAYSGFTQKDDSKTLIKKEFTAEDQFSDKWMDKVDEDEETPQKRAIVKRRQALRNDDDVI